MDTKTKVMIVAGLAVGGYLLYQKQASTNPFTWLPVVRQTPTGPLQQGQIPLVATIGGAAITLLPGAFNAATGLYNQVSGWFGGGSGVPLIPYDVNNEQFGPAFPTYDYGETILPDYSDYQLTLEDNAWLDGYSPSDMVSIWD